MFFKNREARIQFVKTNKNSDQDLYDCEQEGDFPKTAEDLNKVAKDFVKYTALIAVGVLTVSTVLHTLSEIAINASKPKED